MGKEGTNWGMSSLSGDSMSARNLGTFRHSFLLISNSSVFNYGNVLDVFINQALLLFFFRHFCFYLCINSIYYMVYSVADESLFYWNTQERKIHIPLLCSW